MRRSAIISTGVALMLSAWALASVPAIATPNLVAPSSQPQPELTSRWIEIDLSQQKLYAWEGEKLVYSYLVSTGKASTPTPTGRFLIGSRYRSTRMQGRNYNLANVPYTMYFYKGYAIHGAYWHQRFGTPVSHGCVNLSVKDAGQLYNWATLGTLVVVHR
jgi:lipoprotein-anchoring transpeptidase ErfK/SrfK